MARAMRAISDIRPNWLFDASLMMGTTCPRIALMYSISVPPWIKARGVGATQVRPIERRSLDTSTHRRATSNRTRAAWQDSELAGISQQECRPAAAGADVLVSVARLPLCERPDIGHLAAFVRPGIDRPQLVGLAILDHGGVVRASVNRNRDTGAAIVWCRSNLSWSRTSSSEF